VGQIGNLLFVPEAVNQELNTRPFKEKRTILLKREVPMDPYLKKATEWTDKEISERNAILAKVAYEEIWKI
jgi:uncharacterized protein DUF1524